MKVGLLRADAQPSSITRRSCDATSGTILQGAFMLGSQLLGIVIIIILVYGSQSGRLRCARSFCGTPFNTSSMQPPYIVGVAFQSSASVIIIGGSEAMTTTNMPNDAGVTEHPKLIRTYRTRAYLSRAGHIRLDDVLAQQCLLYNGYQRCSRLICINPLRFCSTFIRTGFTLGIAAGRQSLIRPVA